MPIDVAKYGSNTAYNKSSIFNGTQLSAPTLNITAYSTSFALKYYNEYQVPKFSTGPESNGADLPIMYSVAGKAYELQDILHSRASCVNQSDYQWGFSFLLLFLFLIVSIVWTLGMCVMYQDAYWNSRLDRVPRNLGLFRGVADVSKALEMDGVAPSDLASEKEIRRLLNKREGEITFANLDTTGMSTRVADLRAWAKETPSLSKWLEPWTILQWTWLIILVLIGLPFCDYFIDHMIMPLSWWLCCILLFCGLCSKTMRLVRRHRGHHRLVKFRSWLPTRFSKVLGIPSSPELNVHPYDWSALTSVSGTTNSQNLKLPVLKSALLSSPAVHSRNGSCDSASTQ